MRDHAAAPADHQFHDLSPATPPPVWILLGGVVLAANAGFVNGVVLLAGHLPATHLTGSVSSFGADLARGRLEHAALLASVVAAFVLGAMISGVIIGSRELRAGRLYGVAMLVQSLLLGLAALLLKSAPLAAVPLAACAAGAQNAMASSYRRLILRTTHVTGMATDIGLLLGRRLRGHAVRGWELGLLVSMFLAFAAGGVVGGVAADLAGGMALAVSSVLMLAAGLAYRAFRIWRNAHPPRAGAG